MLDTGNSETNPPRNFQGKVVEFDSPSRLLEDTQSVFHSLARGAGLV